METKKFYDIHFHAMDLSHANITAFINCFIEDHKNLLNQKLIKETLKKTIGFWKKLILPIIPFSYLSKTLFNEIQNVLKEGEILNKINKIRNLLSYMESSIMYDFLVVEYFLKHGKNGKSKLVSADNKLQINKETYEKMVICPLIMDFGYMNIDNDHIFYNIPPQKPITSQIKDLFKAIGTYYNNDISINEVNGRIKFESKKIDFDKSRKLFEIYPFMGINPANYKYSEIKEMLNKYFSDFNKNDTKEERQRKLYEKMGTFDGNLENKENCKNIFTGIKLYPPLGFDPWPDDCPQCEEKKDDCACDKPKVKLLYKTCVDRNIPIITHCSTGGFKAAPNHNDLTSPCTKWAEVLKHYPGLKIDFAHFGSDDENWQKKITEYILDPQYKVYTDFSCIAENDEYYKNLENTINKSENSDLLCKRILFGTDFMINMIWFESYNEYLQYFINTSYLTNNKVNFCNTNSEEFLFA